MIAAIVARDRNGVIGIDNDLPWDLPADRVYFRDATRGHTVIMGRKTAESIVARLGHGLPDRENIVVSRDPDYGLKGFWTVNSIEDAIKGAGPDAFVIGGAQIYEQALPYCDRLYITEVDTEVDGDVKFPTLDQDDWQVVSSTPHAADDKNSHTFMFTVLDRKSAS